MIKTITNQKNKKPIKKPLTINYSQKTPHNSKKHKTAHKSKNYENYHKSKKQKTYQKTCYY